jgi:putative nucleotidyltransferase with HDIG domain
MDMLLARVHDLPALPSVVLRVMQLANQSEYSTRELADVIARDPSFSARILKLANSAYYGLPRAVGTISEAVLMLGNHTLRNLALMAATHETMRGAVVGYELEPGQLWRHSLACGLGAEKLASFSSHTDREEAFVAGLLHDVGKMILGLYVGDRMPEIRAYIEENQCSFVEAERAILGFDHAEVGGRIARRWNLPLSLTQAIAWHHEPVQRGQVTPLTAIVHVANICALMAGIGLGADGLGTQVSVAAMQTLHIEATHMEQITEYLLGEVTQGLLSI